MSLFELVRPAGMKEALDLMKESDGYDVILWGGGTATTLLIKQRLISPRLVVDLKSIPELHGITRGEDGSVTIGACTRLRELEQSDLLRLALPSLSQTASLIGNVRVRNAATLAGHLVHADPAQDLPPLLLVLGARIHVEGNGSERVIPVDQFFVDMMETSIEPDEIITKMVIPGEALSSKNRYVKFAPRSLDDYCTVGAAASVQLAEDGETVETVRIAIGGAGPTAMRFPEAEQILRGQPLSPERCREAASIVSELVEPWDDGRGSAGYKQMMSKVWTERVLLSLG